MGIQIPGGGVHAVPRAAPAPWAQSVQSVPEKRMPSGLNDPALPITSARLADLLTGPAVASGVSVNPDSALKVIAVYACVSLISESIAAMPVDMVRKQGRSRVRLDDHPMSVLLSEEPNDEMDAGEMWRQVVGHMLLRGNGFLHAERRGDSIVALWPIDPRRVSPVRRTSNRQLFYRVRLGKDEKAGGLTPQTNVVLDPANMEILHFKAFGFGEWGLSPIDLAKQSIGIALAAEEYGARFFAQDAKPGGVIKSPVELSDQAWNRLKAQWNLLHQGTKNAHQIAVLEAGAAWESVGLPPGDAQFLETREFSVAEIARLYRVPPHMIADVERSTSWGTGIEQQAIGFVQFTLTPWIGRLERVLSRLLRVMVDRSTSVKFNVTSLLRGDMGARFGAYATGRQWGWLSANDIRALEDMEPIEGGDVFWQPANMIPAGTSPEEVASLLRDGRAQLTP